MIKPVIGVVHLPPLPGSPLYRGWETRFEDIVDRAIRDAMTLTEGGVDAIIVENFGDKPFKPRVREPETIAAMAVIVREVRRETGLPVGVNVLRNSGPEALAIAYASGASFIRVNSLVYPSYAPSGVLEPVAREIVELKTKLNADIQVLADVHVKHSVPVHGLSIVEESIEAVERGLADALIVTGKRTGEPVEAKDVVLASKAGKPVLVGSGVTPRNIRLYWKIASGFIVGSYFKEGGRPENPVVVSRVKELMDIVNFLRRKEGL